ncbi:Membrane-anchored glycerophosphoryl diester phosphodiesterase (GDPDase), membrane domain [Microbacterium sp. 8M]|uniref:glycerophosphoryl diester phosphodiesterase membrane domain-containing protein n=1 Tax=Microbacterium sp. 8M TaxID=2653153 RepID=UPI0012F30DFD|nr:glycerophosphoryl diester phosphodiesterase membrane domain-containing protein [Microbacterium sp. 8M]VXB11337.1 Membrane-anchored glycerophosphoryl diester phosphodiesterase (GDPDase), membrane domain [Microbacterium sp. 8M]
MSQQSVNAQGWTPAPRPGLIPLRPLGFGTILGKSFAALRHNPKVLFGFAVVVQLVVTIAVLAVVGAVAFATLSRLRTVQTGSDEWLTLYLGSMAFIGGALLLTGLFSVAFTAIVQGVVAADVRAAVLGEKASLGALWTRVRPAVWRLIGYTLLYGTAAMLAAVVILGVPFVVIGLPTGFDTVGTVFTVLAVLFGILCLVVLSAWIGTKLMLVPSLLVLEGIGVREAIVRSWRLTRGRFWFAFGIVFVIGAILWVVSQTIGMVGGIVTSLFGPVFNPVGMTDASIDASGIVGAVITQLVVVVVQSIGAVVQSTAGALVYIDCRMRYEGLDQDLMAATERRAAGLDDGSDPFRTDPARVVRAGFRPPRVVPYPLLPDPAQEYPAPTGYAPSQGYAPPQGYPAPQGYAAPQNSPAPQGPPAAPSPYAAPAPAAPPPPRVAPIPPAQAIPPAQESPWAPAQDDGWAAPGSDRP